MFSLHVSLIAILVVLVASVVSNADASSQSLESARIHYREYFEFTHPIKRVAVIGAGAAGVQHTAKLIELGFEVRLFERREQPGGVWLYSSKTPIPASFPDAPLNMSAYVPDIPDAGSLPLKRIMKDGEKDVSNDYRLREHWGPSVVWSNLGLITPPAMMPLPNVIYHTDMSTPSAKPHGANRIYAGQKLREYISSVGLNSNSNEYPNVTSWSTRVERIRKIPGSDKWTLNLRKLVRLPYTARNEHDEDDLLVEYWTEEFDAVVVGMVGESDAPHVPDITGLADWARKFPERVYHVRQYRTPEPFAGKNVLIVGDYLSALGVASDLAPHAKAVTLSFRKPFEELTPFQRSGFTHRLPKNVTRVGGIRSFSNLTEGQSDVSEGIVRLENGTELGSFDHVILATGYRTSFPFLADFHNSTIHGFDEPPVESHPILTDGTHLRSLHWTGHYIPDPTLAFAHVDPYTVGRFQAEGTARVWAGTARLPTQERMWAEYPGAGKETRWHPTDVAVASGQRLFVTWLNDEILEFGGRLVDGLRNGNWEGLTHFMRSEWPGVRLARPVFQDVERTPRSKWPVRNGREGRGVETSDSDDFPSQQDSPWGNGRLW